MLIWRSLVLIAPAGPAHPLPSPLPGNGLLIVVISVECLLQGNNDHCDDYQDNCGRNFHTTSYFSAGLHAAYDEGIFDLSFGS